MTYRPAVTPAEQMLRLLGGKMISQAISTVAAIGVPEALRRSPATVADLGSKLGCQPRMLERVMVVLAGEGLFELDDADRYALTDLGEELLEDRLGPLASYLGSTEQWMPWAALRKTVRTGESAYELTHGENIYRRLASHPDLADEYDRSIDRFTTEQACALATHYDFSTAQHVVDVGGGHGTMLIQILRQWPHLTGTLFDLPHVVESTERRLEENGVADRCRFVSGNFFGGLPAGGDVYLLKHVLHNWNDEDARRILCACRAGMDADARLLVVEGILPPGVHNTTARMMDLEMMVLFGQGGERSKLQFKRLFTSAHFRLESYTAPLGHFARLLIGVPRPMTPQP